MMESPIRMMRWSMALLTAPMAAALMTGCASMGSASMGSGEVVRMADGGPDSGIIEESLKVRTRELHQFPEEEGQAPNPAPEVMVAEAMAASHSEGSGGTEEIEEYLDRIGSEYKIGPGDVLEFRSFDDPSLSTEVVVRYDGHISLPLIPDIQVARATREQASQLVRGAYEEFFLDPQISLSIRGVSSKYYYVIGDVMRPAEYPYTRPVTLLEAIYNAGGQRINTRGGDSFVGAQGQLVKAIVFRQVDGQRAVLEYDLSELRRPGPHAADSPVFPSDIVYVPEGVNLVYLLGEVRQPSVRQLTQGMTLLQLLATAGGFNTTTARLREVVLMREIDDETTEVLLVNVRKMLRTGQDFRLKAGDIVYLPQRQLVRLQTFVQQFTGSISPVLSLYNLAWDTWYTDDRLRRLYGSDGFVGGTRTGDLLALQALLQDLQGFQGVVAPTP